MHLEKRLFLEVIFNKWKVKVVSKIASFEVLFTVLMYEMFLFYYTFVFMGLIEIF